MFETSLRMDGQRRLSEIGVADLLVGIPSYKNAETIGHVVETAGDGMLMHFPNLRLSLWWTGAHPMKPSTWQQTGLCLRRSAGL
jgi:hypothetical protein